MRVRIVRVSVTTSRLLGLRSTRRFHLRRPSRADSIGRASVWRWRPPSAGLSRRSQAPKVDIPRERPLDAVAQNPFAGAQHHDRPPLEHCDERLARTDTELPLPQLAPASVVKVKVIVRVNFNVRGLFATGRRRDPGDSRTRRNDGNKRSGSVST
jgi:hypothetical protein